MCCTYLRHRHLKVLLAHILPTLAKSVHSGLCADSANLGTGTVAHLVGEGTEVDTTLQRHLARVDLENGDARVGVGRGELDLAVNTSWSQESRVENVDTVGGHDDLDVLGGLESVKLVEELHHRALHLRVATAAALATTRRTDRVDLVHEDDRGGVFTSHDEQLTDHARTLTNVLLHKLGTRHANEAAVGVVGDSTGEEGLTRTGGSVQEDTLGLSDTERLEEFGVLDGKLDNLLDFLDLLVETTDHLVRRVGNLLHHHERDERVDLVWQDRVEEVRVGAESDAEVGSEGGDGDIRREVDNVLALGLHLDKDLLLAHHLDHLADVASGLLEDLELLAQETHWSLANRCQQGQWLTSCVESIALGLESPEVLSLLGDLMLGRLDLVAVVRLETAASQLHLGLGGSLGDRRHRGRGRRGAGEGEESSGEGDGLCCWRQWRMRVYVKGG